MKYHKISSVYKRHRDGKDIGKFNGEFVDDYVETLYGCDYPFAWTEKLDGTNIRLEIEDGKFKLGGRTDRAQIPVPLLDFVRDNDVDLKMIDKFIGDKSFDGSVTVFGEGVGAKIQKGGGMYGDHRIIVFDVAMQFADGNVWWLERDAVEGIAKDLGLEVAEEYGVGPLRYAEDAVSGIGLISEHGEGRAEGLVCRPEPGIRTRRGDRIIFKVKTIDYQ